MAMQEAKNGFESTLTSKRIQKVVQNPGQFSNEKASITAAVDLSGVNTLEHITSVDPIVFDRTNFGEGQAGEQAFISLLTRPNCEFILEECKTRPSVVLNFDVIWTGEQVVLCKDHVGPVKDIVRRDLLASGKDALDTANTFGRNGWGRS